MPGRISLRHWQRHDDEFQNRLVDGRTIHLDGSVVCKEGKEILFSLKCINKNQQTIVREKMRNEFNQLQVPVSITEKLIKLIAFESDVNKCRENC